MTSVALPLDLTNTEVDAAEFDPRDFRHALGSFATGVTIITACSAEGRLAGLTCNSFTSVSLNPPLVLWSLVSHSPSLTLFQEASHFAVNILGESQAELALRFAKSSLDKFAELDFETGLGNAPLLADGCIAYFQCRNAYRYYGGDHTIFMGSVERYAYSREEPLLFAGGRFRALSTGEDDT